MANQTAAQSSSATLVTGLAPTTLALTTADIKAMSLGAGGALVITKADGSTVTVESFRDMAAHNVKLTLADGQTVDTHKLLETLGGSAPAADHAQDLAANALTIALPEAGKTETVTLHDGQSYVLGFDPKAASSVSVQDGNLVISFADGAKVVIEGYEQSIQHQNAPVLTLADGKVVNGFDLVAPASGDHAKTHGTAQHAASAHQAASDPALAQAAEKLAKVEPAAGDNGGAAGSGHGFGFGSSVDPAPLNDIPNVGPIGPTALQFGIPQFQDKVALVPQSSPAAGTPDITINNGIHDAIVKEDGSIFVPIVAHLGANAVGGEVLTVTVTGIDPSWHITNTDGTYNAATGTWTITLPANTDYTGGLIFAPPANSDIDMSGLNATASAYEPDSGTTATANAGFGIITDAVADTPTISVTNATGNEHTALPVVVHGAVTDTDGSEAVTGYQISGVPTGFTFNHGTDLGGGVWSFTPADMTGLTVSSTPNYYGTVNMTVTVFNAETHLSGSEVDYSDNTNHASTGLNLTWQPVVVPPDITVNNGVHDVIVKEDGSIFVPIVAHLGAGASPGEVLTVTVTGIDPSWHITNTDGTYNAAAGTWTITLAPGQNYTGGLTFAPPANADIDMSGLNATASAYEPATATSATANAGFDVITDAVADKPTLDASASTVEAGHGASHLTIAGHLTDTDGSETITGYQISGVPTDFTFNHGTDLGGGVWSFAPADMTGLTLTPPKTFSGDVALKVTVFNAETHLSGSEVDYTDNTNSATTDLHVTVTPDCNPILLAPQVLTADETNLVTGTVSTGNTLHADFGNDGPGSYAATGVFTSGIPLTSDGVAVAVALVGNTYVGTANGHQVFTLQVTADGHYTFSLTGTLDHPDAANPNDAIALNFGVEAIDNNGDVATASVTVNVLDDAPLAHNDVNTFEMIAGHTDGNVISGLHGGAGAADVLSQDAPNHVTAVQFGSTIVTVPTVGTASIHGDHGTLVIASDGSYTYTLDAGAGGGTGGTTPKEFTTSFLFPTEHEGTALPGGQPYYGITPGDLTVSTASTGTITFVSEGAGYNNTVGMYLINPDGSISNAGILIENGNNTTFGQPYNFNVGAGQTVGFFLIADGYTANGGYAGIDPSTETMHLYYKFGTPDQRLATTGDSSSDISIVYTDSHGANTVLSGTTYYSSVQGGPDMNADGTVRVVSGLTDPNDHTTLRVGFEDLPNLGDKDYNDIVFDVTLNQTATTPATDQFVYTLTDGDGDPSKATLTFDATPPHVLPPTLVVDNGVHDAIVKEDGSIFVPITAHLDPAGPSTQVLTVTVTGIDPSWHLTNADGSYNAATGTWTITLPAGQNYNGGLTFAPPANSDADMTNLHVTALATEPVTSESASTNGGFSVITDAVADKPTLDASATTVKEDHGSSTVSIAGHLTDTDGSEAITGYQISGVPTGFTFNHGTNAGGGVWTFTPADIAGLTVTPAHGYSGTANLTVTVFNAETHLSGSEVDYTDNTNSASKALSIVVEPNCVPVITTPAPLTTDESNLHSGTVTVHGTVTADFGTDAPGAFSATGASAFSYGGSVAGGALTSDGVPVAVTFSGNTYTGKAGSETIFTLTVAANGSYTFNLIGNLDHADKTNPNDSIALNFGVTATDSDGDSARGTITVNVLDDAPLAVNDSAKVDGGDPHATASGNVLTNDHFSVDTPDTVSAISFNGHSVAVTAGAAAVINGQYGVLSITADGTYTYALNSGIHSGSGDQFTYTLRDGDGDTSNATLSVGITCPTLIVGTNVDDKGDSTVPYQVGAGHGTITGGQASDILIGDVGGSTMIDQHQDYNVVMMLDVSGSMGSKNDPSSRISLLVEAVKNLMTDFHNYHTGNIEVHLVPFSTTDGAETTFMVTSDAGYNQVMQYLGTLNGGGNTNYEAPMQAAINWLQGPQPIAGATNISYFVSDGQPNTYNDNYGHAVDGSVSQVIAQLNGTADGTDEIDTLKSLSQVVGVGIDVGSAISNIDILTTSGHAINVTDPTQLTSTLSDLSPLNHVASVGADHLVGGDGNDLIFGDSVNTDALAVAQGLSTAPGDGWDVFAKLEAGQSALTPGWTRADTISYIESHADQLAAQTIGSDGSGRAGGNDQIEGGAGNDVIYGQEGNDIITGGAGNDILHGGSGADMFVYNAVNEGLDHIADFKTSEGDVLDLSHLLGSVGYDPVTSAIHNFVFATDTAAGTVIAVDATGTGNAAGAQAITVLDGVHGVTVDDLLNSHSIATA